jgi:hypothetical protein
MRCLVVLSELATRKRNGAQDNCSFLDFDDTSFSSFTTARDELSDHGGDDISLCFEPSCSSHFPILDTPNDLFCVGILSYNIHRHEVLVILQEPILTTRFALTNVFCAEHGSRLVRQSDQAPPWRIWTEVISSNLDAWIVTCRESSTTAVSYVNPSIF